MTPAPTLTALRVRFYHGNDERAFFEWLSRIPCVESFKGVGNAIEIRLRGAPDDDDLRELLGFCFRYGINMRQLAQFSNDQNTGWFRNPVAYWHKKVFGSTPA